jgi:hypothetical protein
MEYPECLPTLLNPLAERTRQSAASIATRRGGGDVIVARACEFHPWFSLQNRQGGIELTARPAAQAHKMGSDERSVWPCTACGGVILTRAPLYIS